MLRFHHVPCTTHRTTHWCANGARKESIVAEATKVFWEGPGESRNRSGVTCKATVRPDGKCVIANHSSHADLRVGDVQIVFQVNRCQVEEITVDQHEALHVVLEEMFFRICAEVSKETEQDEGDAEEQDAAGDDAVEHVDADENDEAAEDEELDDGESEYSDSNGELMDADLAVLSDFELADRIRTLDDLCDDNPLVRRYHAHLHEQELLVSLYREFNLDTTRDRIIECMIEQGDTSRWLTNDQLVYFVLTCKKEHRSALITACTERERWDAFLGLDEHRLSPVIEKQVFDECGVCILNACSDQDKLRKVAYDGCWDYAAVVRRAALERITDVQDLQGLIKDIVADTGEDDTLLDPARERLAALQRKQR